jgi:hypothetical protein
LEELKLGDNVGYLASEPGACFGSSNILVIVVGTLLIRLASASVTIGGYCIRMSLI